MKLRATARVLQVGGEYEIETDSGVFCKWERDMKLRAKERVVEVGGGDEIGRGRWCVGGGKGIASQEQ